MKGCFPASIQFKDTEEVEIIISYPNVSAFEGSVGTCITAYDGNAFMLDCCSNLQQVYTLGGALTLQQYGTTTQGGSHISSTFLLIASRIPPNALKFTACFFASPDLVPQIAQHSSIAVIKTTLSESTPSTSSATQAERVNLGTWDFSWMTSMQEDSTSLRGFILLEFMRDVSEGVWIVSPMQESLESVSEALELTKLTRTRVLSNPELESSRVHLVRRQPIYHMRKGDIWPIPHGITELSLSLTWDSKVDADISAVCCSQNGKVRSVLDFGNPSAFNRALTHSGDQRRGDTKGSDDEYINIRLKGIPHGITDIFFICNVYQEGKNCLALQKNAFCRVLNCTSEILGNTGTQNELCHMQLLKPLTITTTESASTKASIADQEGVVYACLSRLPARSLTCSGPQRSSSLLLTPLCTGSSECPASPCTVTLPMIPSLEYAQTPTSNWWCFRSLMRSFPGRTVHDVLDSIPSIHRTMLEKFPMYGSPHASTRYPLKMRRIVLESAVNLRPSDPNGKSDPYVKAYLHPSNLKVYTSSVVPKNLHPVWNEVLDLPLPSNSALGHPDLDDPLQPQLVADTPATCFSSEVLNRSDCGYRFVIMDADILKDDWNGEVRVLDGDLKPGKHVLTIRDKKMKPCGFLHISVLC